MKVNERAALENLVRVCEESLSLIRQLIESQDAAYTAGYQDGLAESKKPNEGTNVPNEGTHHDI
jgi:hypothetical protein